MEELASDEEENLECEGTNNQEVDFNNY